MRLEGSCTCRAVRFSLESRTPVPYLRCYCSICRKTAGGGGYAINIMGEAATLSVKGKRRLGVFRAWLDDPTARGGRRKSPGRRHFCTRCGSALWVFDPRWPDWVYPFASAIDTPLPAPPERVHVMLDSAASWVRVPRGKREIRLSGLPAESIEDWHRRHRLYGKE